MASIAPHKDGYRAQVYVKGQRDSATFRTKREASAWASQRETELRQSAQTPDSEKHSLADAMRKYKEEITPTKRGKRWEEVRLDKFLRDPDMPTGAKIGSVTPAMIGEWRDKALKRISPSSVVRELALISSVFEAARREWKWVAVNPVRDVRKPSMPDHRFVTISRPQIRAMLSAMAYKPGRCSTVTGSVALTFMFALRTGMRAGEICALRWGDVFEDYCELTGTEAGARKTKHAVRSVPLTPKAKRIVEMMRGFDAEFVFGLKTASLDAMFRKYRQRAGLEGFTFHDTRHTAATWLARRLHILDLCRMFGWGNPSMAMIYYNATASDIAKLLSQAAPGRPR